MALIRRFKPQVITTYDERGGYPHPDHIKTHEISVHAFDAAGDPDRYPELGEPWQPSKLYYHMSFTLPRTKALHEAILATGAESPYTEWLANWDPAHDISHRVTTRVPCAEYFPVRDAALIAHATQIDPEGRWFACPIDTQQQIWPTEDYELARSLVDVAVPGGRSVHRYPQRGGGPMSADLLAAAGDQLPEDVGKSGPLGLLLTLLLLIAVIFLVRSMSRHLKRVPPSFDPADRRRRSPTPRPSCSSPARRRPARHPAQGAARASSHPAAPTTAGQPPAGSADRPAAAGCRALPAVRDVDHQTRPVGRTRRPGQGEHPERQPGPDAEPEAWSRPRTSRPRRPAGTSMNPDTSTSSLVLLGMTTWSGVVARPRSAGTRRRGAPPAVRSGPPSRG